jgi:FkbM family methyltransferase
MTALLSPQTAVDRSGANSVNCSHCVLRPLPGFPAMLLKSLKTTYRRYRLQRARVLEESAAAGQSLGRPVELGNWTMLPAPLSPHSVVYSFGVGDNIAWDLAVIERSGATVHAFDPTPASIAWVRQQNLPDALQFHPWGLAAFDGELALYPPRKAGNTHYSQERRRRPWSRYLVPRAGDYPPPPVLAPVRRLQSTLAALGHERIDVLKLDIEGSEFEAIPDILASGIEIDQLLVEIHYHFPSRSLRAGLRLIAQIQAAGFRCFHISPRGLEFSFVRQHLLAYRQTELASDK